MFAVRQPVFLIPNTILLQFIFFLVHPLWLTSFFLWCAVTIRQSAFSSCYYLQNSFHFRLLFLSFYSLRTAQRNSSFISYFDIRFPYSIFMLNLHKKNWTVLIHGNATQMIPCVITAS